MPFLSTRNNSTPFTRPVHAPLLLTTLLLTAHAFAERADSVYLNDRIYTVDEAQPRAEALAVRGKRKFIGETTSVIDLARVWSMPVVVMQPGS